MEVAIIGGGSLGLMWCARLLLGGARPTLIVRTDEQKELLHEQGLTYTEKGDSHLVHPTVESMAGYQDELPLCTILTVKQTHISSLLPFLQRHINKKGFVFTIQNGLGHFEKLSEVIAQNQIILGSTSDGALRHQSNHVERTGYGETWFGQQGEDEPPSTIKDSFEYLQQIGFSLQWDTQIMMRLWRKCLINCTINPLTAILGVNNGELLRSEAAQRTMREIYNEGIQVALTNGFQFYEDLWQEIADVCRNTSRNRSSMLQDVIRNRKTEIDYINGYIVRAGAQSGIQTPYNQLMLQLIHTKEQLHNHQVDDQAN